MNGGAGDETGSNRVKRGGSWNNNARNVRAANRNRNDPGNRNNNLGFRPVSSRQRPEGRCPWMPVQCPGLDHCPRSRAVRNGRTKSPGAVSAGRSLEDSKVGTAPDTRDVGPWPGYVDSARVGE